MKKINIVSSLFILAGIIYAIWMTFSGFSCTADNYSCSWNEISAIISIVFISTPLLLVGVIIFVVGKVIEKKKSKKDKPVG